MNIQAQTTIIEEKLSQLIEAFTPILYEDDDIFLENMKDRNLAGDDIRRYQHWEWTQGVGLYGLWSQIVCHCFSRHNTIFILTGRIANL